MHSYTLANWDGSYAEREATNGTLGMTSSTLNAGPSSSNVASNGAGLDTGRAQARKESVERGRDVPLNNLFDEDTPVTLASPAKKLYTSQLGGFPPEPIASSSRITPSRPSEPRGEVVSVYSEDAEGEDEADEDVEIIDLTRAETLPKHAPTPISIASSPPLHSSDNLFSSPLSGPSDSSMPHPRKKKRICFVGVPSLPKAKRKAYKSIASLGLQAQWDGKPVKMKRPPVLNALQREQAARSKPGVVVHDDLSLALNSAIRKNHDSSRAPKRKSQDDAAWEAPAVKKPRPVMQNRVEEREAPAAKKARPNIPSVKSQVDAAEGSRSAVKKPRPTIPPLPSRGTMPPPPPPLPLPKKSAPKKPRASKPPPPPWTYDKASDSLCLLSTNFFFSDLELWMNARHLLPAPQDKIDERALALPSRPDWNRGQPWGKDIEEGEDVDAELTVGEWWLPEYEDDYEELEELGRKGDGEGLGVESEDSVGEGAVAQERFGTPEIPLPKTKPPSVRVKSPVKVQQPGAAAIVAPSPSQNAQSHMVTSPHASPLLLPSLKALGKRREEPPGPRSPSRMNVGNGFINMLRPKPASPICSTLHPNSGLPMNIYRNPQSSEVLLASINTSPAASSGLRHIPVENQSPFYVDHNAAAVPPLVDDDLGTSSFSLTSEGAQWGAAPQEEYHFDTINPTLLQQPDEIMAYGFGDAGVQDDLGFLNLDGGDDELGYPDIELGYPEEPKKPENDIYMSDGEHGGGALGEEEERRLGGAVRVGAEEEEVPWSGSSSSSSFSGSSSDSSRAPTPVSEKKKVTKKVVLAGPSPTIRRPRPTPPSDIELLLGEMPVYKSDSDDADWNGSKGSPKLGRGKRKKRKTRNADEWVEYRHLADELVDEYVPPGEPLPTTSTKVGPPPTSARLRIGPPRGIKWKVGDEEGFCHQCRSKSTKLKMSCNGCTKLYCNRCISIRYVDLVFASAFSSTSPCPFCSSSCNCDACCRKRGETYISPSGIARAPDSAPKTRQLEPREPRALRQKQQKAVVVPSISRLPALPTIIRVPSGSNLEEFGPIYSLDGSKLKVVYSNEVESTEAAVVDSEPIRIEEPYKARRVFIGAIPKSWRLQQPKVVDLEPCEESAGLVGRKGGAAAKKVKMYVGKPIEPPPPVVAAPVPVGDGSEEEEEEEDGEISVGSEPPGKLDLSDFGLMFDSPLTSLPDSEVEGSVDEDDGKSFATHSLEDVDLARAISAGLAAIGVPVEHPSLPEP